MPSTWNGIGTSFIGAKDRYPDDSFVTTEWFVFLTLPVIPLRSLRVLFLGNSTGWRRSSSKYHVIGGAPLDIKNILLTYFITIISVISGIWLFFTIMSAFAYTNWGPVVGVLGLFVPYIIAQWLFFNAK